MPSDSSDASDPAPSLIELGGRLRKARENLGFSVAELASLLDVTGPYVSVLERGERKPLAPVVIRACGVLGLPVASTLELAGHRTDAGAWPGPVLIELAVGVGPVTDRDVADVKRMLVRRLQRRASRNA